MGAGRFCPFLPLFSRLRFQSIPHFFPPRPAFFCTRSIQSRFALRQFAAADSSIPLPAKNESFPAREFFPFLSSLGPKWGSFFIFRNLTGRLFPPASISRKNCLSEIFHSALFSRPPNWVVFYSLVCILFQLSFLFSFQLKQGVPRVFCRGGAASPPVPPLFCSEI